MMANIPDDIIFYNILTRVPAISLLRFKSVSKQWYNLFSSVTFTSLQHDYAIASHDSIESDLLIVSRGCFYTYLDAPCFTSAKDVFTETPYPNHLIIIGCCNGLVCIRLMREGRCVNVLCNPLTRESSRLIDDPPCDLPTDIYNYYESHGFGYDSISHDYKIVKITSLGDFAPHVAHIEIYSTGNDIWKQGGEIPYHMHLDGCYGVSLNNKLHWVIIDGNSNLSSILTIDLHNGVVGKMPVPDKLLHLLEDGSSGFLNLMVSNGCLYTIMKRQIGTSKSIIISIWLMKEYGVSESWAKLCNLGDEVSSCKIQVITYRSNKEREEVLLLEFGDDQPDKLMWYNLKDKSVRKVDSTKGKRPFGKDWVCIGSLASIPAMIKGNVA